MKYLIIFIISFIIFYLLYLTTVVLRKSKIEKYKNGRQIQFFVRKYGLSFKNISPTKFYNLLSIVNSFIMGVTVMIIFSIENIIIKFLLAFVIIIILILLCYSLLGMYIRKKDS